MRHGRVWRVVTNIGAIGVACLMGLTGCASMSPLAGRDIALAHWRARDVAADAGSGAANAGLKLEPVNRAARRSLESSCVVIDSTNAERAVTLAYVIPIDATGWSWWDDPDRGRTITGDKPFQNIVDYYHAEPVFMSYYPMAVISNGASALCIAVPPEPARVVRFLYDPVVKELRAEFDFGLSPTPEHFPSRADAAVRVFRVGPKWAFRRALARYYSLYPEAFKRRVGEGGIWMPFQSIEPIERPEDFHIAFREVAYGDWASLAFDKQHGVRSYVYVEPQTNWRDLRGNERTYDQYVKQLREDANKGDRKAQATLVSAVEREDGRNDLYLDSIAWTRSAPFGANADPDVATEGFDGWPNKGQYELQQLRSAIVEHSLDGVYVDSMEGWGAMRNYRKAHWRTTRYPLTFHQETKRVCLMSFWGTHAFVKQLTTELHEHNTLLFGNGAFHRFWQLAPYVDIPGMEYGWFTEGKWTPVPDWQFLFLRAMSAQRPYLLLMNNAFEDAGQMEEYFQRSLFYGCYPSMFHGHTGTSVPYFSKPEWYNRDRPLFMKYIPLIQKLDSAGWQPVPYAEVEPAEIRIERFGDGRSNNLAFTLHNSAADTRSVVVTLSLRDLRLARRVAATEWITGRDVPMRARGDTVRIALELSANGYAVVGLKAIADNLPVQPRP
ncbi:MAG: hypothetical protein HZB26_10320 [Candidatus Hydrogenedentes bacterium]|nr:hypothetical protein [Candidatus Hydrogenedentota bacterium]